jgi:hypothetical protein
MGPSPAGLRHLPVQSDRPQGSFASADAERAAVSAGRLTVSMGTAAVTRFIRHTQFHLRQQRLRRPGVLERTMSEWSSLLTALCPSRIVTANQLSSRCEISARRGDFAQRLSGPSVFAGNSCGAIGACIATVEQHLLSRG